MSSVSSSIFLYIALIEFFALVFALLPRRRTSLELVRLSQENARLAAELEESKAALANVPQDDNMDAFNDIQRVKEFEEGILLNVSTVSNASAQMSESAVTLYA